MDVNNIVICKKNHKTDKEFRKAISKAVDLLLEEDYVMVVRYDEKGLGIVVIEYSEADPSYGAPRPVWTDDNFYGLKEEEAEDNS